MRQDSAHSFLFRLSGEAGFRTLRLEREHGYCYVGKISAPENHCTKLESNFIQISCFYSWSNCCRKLVRAPCERNWERRLWADRPLVVAPQSYTTNRPLRVVRKRRTLSPCSFLLVRQDSAHLERNEGRILEGRIRHAKNAPRRTKIPAPTLNANTFSRVSKPFRRIR